MTTEQIQKITKIFIICTFVTLYVMVSIISTIHVIDFFRLSNPEWLANTLAISFEVGAAASLASIIALKKMNKTIVWILFFILTLMQAMGNTYYAYTHLINYQKWIELFGMVDYDIIEQKRILSLVSGAILPVVALGFIKSLVDYIKPEPEVPGLPIPKDILFVSHTGNTEPVDISKPKEPDLDSIIKAGKDAEHKKILEMVAKKHQERIDNGETFEDEPTALANSGLTEQISEPEEQSILDKIKVFNNGDTK